MIPTVFGPLASDLWQSTWFAAAAGLLTLILRRNQARVRYWLWLVASYKFLLPFAWLVSFGSLFEWRAAPPPVTLAVTQFTSTVSRPMLFVSSSGAQGMPQHAPVLPVVVLGVWACGFAIVVAGWVRQWVRLSGVVRAAAPLHLGLPIPVVSTAARLEPGVFGIFRPVLLLPEGITSRLTRDQLQSVFAHELCHVRRRDNLAAAVHMLVEALFWFYPLVWWLGARMIDERERVCDEEVLLAGSQAQVYAESILKVCEFYTESPLHCLAGVTGSDLKKRVERIMKSNIGVALNSWRKVFLATAGVIALALPFVVGMFPVQTVRAQAPLWPTPGSPKLTFEVASIKANTSSEPKHWNIATGPGDFMRPVGGRYSVSNMPLLEIIGFAYKLAGNIQYLMPGIPSWAATERFDIEAKAEGDPKKDEFRLMVQSLLADRFQMKMHKETRELPAFALVLAKNGKTGPQIMPHTDDSLCAPMGQFQGVGNQSGAAPTLDAKTPLPALPCGVFTGLPSSAPGRMHLGGRKITMELIATTMSGFDNLTRPIVDRTGLTGTFDLWMEFSPQINGDGPVPPGFQSDPTGPSLEEALQEQLGLKLELQKAPIDVMVVDHLERPSEN